MSYEQEYDNLIHDPSRFKNFWTTGKKGRKVFSLNTNIKTLQTAGKYVSEMYNETTRTESNKQKIVPLKTFNFRSIDNHSDARAILRSDIVIAAGNRFGGYDSAIVKFLIYMLLLDVGDNPSVIEKPMKFVNNLPVFIKRRLYEYANEIANSESLLINNIYQQMVVLYGDELLFSEFINFVEEKYPDERQISELFAREYNDLNSPIRKRINIFQASTMKEDALYPIILYSLDQYVRKCRFKGFRSGKRIISAHVFLENFINYFNDIFNGHFEWLGRYATGAEIADLIEFINNDLSIFQRKELYLCIRNAFGLQVPT